MAESDSSSARAFLAAPLPDPCVDAIRRWRNKIEGRFPARGVRWLPSNQWHLTLKFFGKVDRPRLPHLIGILQPLCQSFAPFTVTFRDFGAFPGLRSPRVLWLGLEGQTEILKRLQDQSDAATQGYGQVQEKRDFHPHLTLARVKATSRENLAIASAIAQIKAPPLCDWTIDRLVLMESTLSPSGAKYAALATFLFRK